MTAVAVGSDLGARLSAAPTGALGVDHHWFPISNVGVFSATAAAGKILGLSEEQMINALGLALHRCHGQLEAIAAPESELRAIRDGFINKEGVIVVSGTEGVHHRKLSITDSTTAKLFHLIAKHADAAFFASGEIRAGSQSDANGETAGCASAKCCQYGGQKAVPANPRYNRSAIRSHGDEPRD